MCVDKDHLLTKLLLDQTDLLRDQLSYVVVLELVTLFELCVDLKNSVLVLCKVQRDLLLRR